MRKRSALLALPVMVLCLLLPAQAVATPSFITTVERDTCVSGAGKWGYGQGVLRIRIIEYGKSGANRFTFTAQVWQRPIHGSTWTKAHEWALGVYSFPNNNQSYYNSRQYAWAPNHNVYFKIVVRVRALHDNTVLYSRLFQGKTC